MIIIQITCLSRSNEKIAAPPARGRRGRLERRGGCSALSAAAKPAVSSFPGARAPGYFSLALCKQDNLLRPKGAQITIVSQTNIRHARPPEAREGPLSRRRGQAGLRGAAPRGRRSLLRPCPHLPASCARSLKVDPWRAFPCGLQCEMPCLFGGFSPI